MLGKNRLATKNINELKKPAAVLLDLDNTVYEYEPAHCCAMKAIIEKIQHSLGVNKSDFLSAFQTARASIKRELGSTASSHSRLLYFQRTLEILGFKSQILLALDLEQTYWRTFLVNAELFENVGDFLDDLRLADIPIALVTDLTAQIQFRKLVYFELDNYIDYIVTSEEVGENKPSQRPFLKALEKLNLEQGQTFWMIGDDLHKDIQGARQAIEAITFQKIHDHPKQGYPKSELELKQQPVVADFEFTSFRQLRTILKSIFQDATRRVA